MPVHYVINKEQRLVLTVGEGILTFTEVERHQDQLLADPNRDPKFNQLIDMTNAKEVSLSVAEAKQIARRAVFSPDSRRAVVASEKSVYGVFRMMQVYHETTAGHSHVGIFYDRDEALQWLGIKEDSGLF